MYTMIFRTKEGREMELTGLYDINDQRVDKFLASVEKRGLKLLIDHDTGQPMFGAMDEDTGQHIVGQLIPTFRPDRERRSVSIRFLKGNEVLEHQHWKEEARTFNGAVSAIQVHRQYLSEPLGTDKIVITIE